jgi:anti-sigma-K factor RskA
LAYKMAHENFQELMPGHSLSALDLPETDSLEGHLATCEVCRDEQDLWRSTAAALALSSAAVEPSPRVREQILEQVRKDKKATPTDLATEDAKVVPFTAQRRNVWSSVGSWSAIAASIALLAVLTALFVVWRENRSLKGELAQIKSQVSLTEAELARERETIALLTGSGARLTELAGTNIARGARATIAYDPDGRALLLASGLPAAPPGKAYQLWFIVGNQKLPGKVFSTDATGSGKLRDEIPAIARAGAVFAVTLEPAEGVLAPTGQIFLVSGS